MRPVQVLIVAFAFAFSIGSPAGESASDEGPDTVTVEREAVEVAVPSGEFSKIAPWARRQFDRMRAMSARGEPAGGGDRPAPDAYAMTVEFDSEFSLERFRVPGAEVVSSIGTLADLVIPLDEAVLAAVEAAPGVVWISGVRELSLPPPPVIKQGAATKGRPEEIVRGGHGGLTGKGVIIAIIDSGIDFRHEDFIVRDAAGRPSTRLLAFWDTGRAWDGRTGGRPPQVAGRPRGTVYTREQLDAELRGGVVRIKQPDPVGHGTSCASIAAGNGRNSKGRFTGVAPGADLVVVKTNLGDDSVIDAAIAWVLDVARAHGKPCVVSCSFGGQFGLRNGEETLEQKINLRFPDSAKGRAIVIAAGNEGDARLHARAAFAGASQPAVFAWEALIDQHPMTGEKLRVSLLIETADPSTVWSNLVGKKEGISFERFGSGGAVGTLQPLKSGEILLPVAVNPGIGGIIIHNRSGQRMSVTAYVDYLPTSKPPVQFLPEVVHGGKTIRVATAGGQVATPATARQAIAVGSYDWNDRFDQGAVMVSLVDTCSGSPLNIGDLSCYSNAGPSREELPSGRRVVKPDIVAPGAWFHAGAARSYEAGPKGTLLGGSPGIPPPYLEPTGRYQAFNGTSAATPYAAGVIALMFEKKPDLTVGEIRRILHASATKDPRLAPSYPDARWGYGRLDKAAVGRLVAELSATGSAPAARIRNLRIGALGNKLAATRVVSMTLDLSAPAPGAWCVRLSQGDPGTLLSVGRRQFQDVVTEAASQSLNATYFMFVDTSLFKLSPYNFKGVPLTADVFAQSCKSVKEDVFARPLATGKATMHRLPAAGMS